MLDHLRLSDRGSLTWQYTDLLEERLHHLRVLNFQENLLQLGVVLFADEVRLEGSFRRSEHALKATFGAEEARQIQRGDLIGPSFA